MDGVNLCAPTLGPCFMIRTLVLFMIVFFVTASAEAAEITPLGDNGTCLECHTNAGFLMQTVKPPPPTSEDSCASAPGRPAFLNAFVNVKFPKSTHGRIGCTGCHQGDATAQDAGHAHAGMIKAVGGCKDCHAEIATRYATSLHNTLDGMAHALKLRSGENNFHKLNPMWKDDCATCHAACSDCHLTLPKAVGGGLIKGHDFFKRPPMQQTCAVCHGSRAGGEYLGHNQGVASDVHFLAGMDCLDCHKNDLHGDGESYTNRWQVKNRPQCTDCHSGLPNTKSRNHSSEHQDVSCQVCHSQPYQNCFACHSDDEGGTYSRKAGHKELTLKIGDNTVPGYRYGTVTLRKNPVARNSFDYLGVNLLPNFDAYPTWKTTAPHNIMLSPPQSRDCSSCHDNDALFLHDEILEQKAN